MRGLLRSKKGQIGEILVVVILLVLAVVGVLRFILPMFNQGGEMTDQVSTGISGITASANYGQPDGTMMTGVSVKSDINQILSNLLGRTSDQLTITVTSLNSTANMQTGSQSSASANITNVIRSTGMYKKFITQQGGYVTAITYNLQNGV